MGESLLKENGYRLTDTTYFLDLVPFVSQQERALIQSEIQGTTRMGEVLAVVIRFEVKQRLVRLEFLQKSVKELISILSVGLGAVMHD